MARRNGPSPARSRTPNHLPSHNLALAHSLSPPPRPFVEAGVFAAPCRTLGRLDIQMGWPSFSQSLQCGRTFFSGADQVSGKIEGAVVAYGPTGNLVTDIPNDRLKG